MQKRRKKSYGYAIFLTLYILIIIIAAAFGLSKLWGYAEEYELSRPERTMDAYVEKLNLNHWDDTIAETVSNMEHEMQSDEECSQIIKDLLSSEITYSRGAAIGGPGTLTYVLKCSDGSFGRVILAEDTSFESEYELFPWIVQSEEFDFTGLYTGIEVTVPESYYVFINNNPLGSEYIVEKDIHYDVLEDYYKDYDGLPTKVTYRFDKIIGKAEPVIKDQKGNIVTIDSDRDDSQFLRECTSGELDRLRTFSENFCKGYFEYTAGIYDPTYGYQRILPYIVKGSDLDDRLKLAMDGLYFSHTKSVKVENINLDNAFFMGDNIYLCEISADVTTFGPRGVESANESMKVIAVNDGGEYKAVSQEQN